MEKVTLSFSAKGQSLTGCPFKFASNTVNYIEAKFELGENWGGFDSVRAVWFTDFNCISTVLDTDGVCVVPHEVLNKAKREVKVNLVGSIVENGELTDRLTTYPIKAIIIDANAKICGSETAEVTPSQFEQFVEAVKAEVAKIKDIDSVELNDDYTLTIYFSDDTETTVGPIRGEQGPAGPQGEQGETGNGIASIEKTGTAGYVDTYTITFTDGTTTTFEVRNGEVSLETLESLMPIDTASGDIASFPDGQNVFPLKSLVADINPIQDLSHGDPSPTNICPISGHDDVEVGVVGVNQWDEEWEVGQYYDGDGKWNSSGTRVCSKRNNPIKVVPNASYYVGSGTTVIWFDENGKTYNNGTGYIGYAYAPIVTAPSNAKYMRFYKGSSYGTTYNNDISINHPSTDHEYHAYVGTTYPVSWQTEAGTVYGGKLDLVTGVLTVDRKYAPMPKTGWSQNSVSGANAFYQYTLSDAISVASNIDDQIRVISNMFNGTSSHDVIGAISGFYSVAIITNKRLFVYVPSATFPNVNSFMTWLQTQDIHIVYELATPLTYQLTPQQIQTLVGVNNVWADSGDVEVVYIADIKLYVDNH